MSRPKSTWAEMIGSLGAIGAAAGAQRAAREVHELRAQQAQSFSMLQEYLEVERRRHEAEEQLRDEVRKLKQELFDFNQVLLELETGIRSFIPDFYCGVALFKESDLERRARYFHESRELLESHEDKMLIKKVVDGVASIRKSLEEQASAEGLTLDEVVDRLLDRWGEINEWRRRVFKARDEAEKLSRLMREVESIDSDSFSGMLRKVHSQMEQTRRTAEHALVDGGDFSTTLAFLKNHERIREVWQNVLEVTPDSLESLRLRVQEVLARAHDIVGVGQRRKDNLTQLGELLSRHQDEDFLTTLASCASEVRDLPPVARWAGTAQERLQRVGSLVDQAEAATKDRNWKLALKYLEEGMSITSGGELGRRMGRLWVAALYALAPQKLLLIAAIGAVLGGVSFRFGLFRWFLAVVGFLFLLQILLLVPEVVRSRKGGLTWREIFEGLRLFFLRLIVKL